MISFSICDGYIVYPKIPMMSHIANAYYGSLGWFSISQCYFRKMTDCYYSIKITILLIFLIYSINITSHVVYIANIT